MADGNSLIPISDEQAKLGQEALKLLQGLGSFFGKALGSVPEDLAGYLGGDWLRARRVENIAKLLSSTKEKLEARGVKDTKPACLTLALPILRGAADESREELRDLWARLLAAAMDPSRKRIFASDLQRPFRRWTLLMLVCWFTYAPKREFFRTMQGLPCQNIWGLPWMNFQSHCRTY